MVCVTATLETEIPLARSCFVPGTQSTNKAAAHNNISQYSKSVFIVSFVLRAVAKKVIKRMYAVSLVARSK